MSYYIRQTKWLNTWLALYVVVVLVEPELIGPIVLNRHYTLISTLNGNRIKSKFQGCTLCLLYMCFILPNPTSEIKTFDYGNGKTNKIEVS